MSRKPAPGEARRFEPPEGAIRKLAFTPRGTELVVRITNKGNRALHYISEIMTVRFDQATKRLVVGLAEDGRALVAGAAMLHPDFRYVDPGSAAELKLSLPPRYLRLAPNAAPLGGLMFEELRPADASEIVVEIAWADTPFYENPRGAPPDAMPTTEWALGKLTMSHRVPRDGPNPETGPKSKAAPKR